VQFWKINETPIIGYIDVALAGAWRMAIGALTAWLSVMVGHDSGSDSGGPEPRGNLQLILILLCAVLIGAGFFALFR
jgi:hypothetical protein